jgi:hypothetical protein
MPIAIALDAALALFKRYRILIAVVPLAIALGVQTWRLNSTKDALEDCRTDQARILAASEVNLKAQIAQREKEKAAYQRANEIAEETHAKELASAHDSLDRYITANRVRKNHSGSGAHSAGQDQDSGAREDLPADAILVSEADLRICTDNAASAVATYEYFQKLKQDGYAE